MLRNRHRLRLPRIPRVLIATLTLAFALAMTVYAAHVHERSAKSAVTHCEVCLHLSGAAGAPSPPPLAGFVPLVTFEAVVQRIRPFVIQHRARAHRSRAPPLSP